MLLERIALERFGQLDQQASSPPLRFGLGPCLRLALQMLALLNVPHESFHLASRVHDPLFPGEKRVALGADVSLEGLTRRPRLPAVTAGAGNGDLLVFGMNARLQRNPPHLAVG